MINTLLWSDTIVATATAEGIGAIAIIRLSGNNAISIANNLFPSKDLLNQPTASLHVGYLHYKNTEIDEVVISIFKNPKSYTGEDVVEISCHGSSIIIKQIIEACVDSGARVAAAGEFTQRAFLNGKLDLAQAEAVADLIAAESTLAKDLALKQLRGGFSNELQKLKEELIHFVALIELELDFAEEDVEFADRAALKQLVKNIQNHVDGLVESFALGNAIKNGISVAIIGEPNVGKSTLLNALLNEERAIVSDIAGTTRDTIEETLTISGVLFRFIDTAGIRSHTIDAIEKLGIERSIQNAQKANLVLWLVDDSEQLQKSQSWMQEHLSKTILVFNKIDLNYFSSEALPKDILQSISISAKNKSGISELKNIIFAETVDKKGNTSQTIVVNMRHVEALKKLQEILKKISDGIDQNISGDLLTVDIKQGLHYLGSITGQIENDRDILGAIFSKFCIGK